MLIRTKLDKKIEKKKFNKKIKFKIVNFKPA